MGRRWGLYFDAKKVFLETSATAVLDGAPLKADIQDPAGTAAEQQYRNGAVTLIDVVDSDRQLLIAEDDLARVQADTARAAVRSYRALGGGW